MTPYRSDFCSRKPSLPASSLGSPVFGLWPVGLGFYLASLRAFARRGAAPSSPSRLAKRCRVTINHRSKACRRSKIRYRSKIRRRLKICCHPKICCRLTIFPRLKGCGHPKGCGYPKILFHLRIHCLLKIRPRPKVFCLSKAWIWESTERRRRRRSTRRR